MAVARRNRGKQPSIDDKLFQQVRSRTDTLEEGGVPVGNAEVLGCHAEKPNGPESLFKAPGQGREAQVSLARS